MRRLSGSGWLVGVLVVAALVALATAVMAEVLPPPPVPPPPSVKAVIAGDDGTLLFGQLRPMPPPAATPSPPPPPLWWVWLGPVVSGTDLDLLGTGWMPEGRSCWISGGDSGIPAADLLRLPYPALKPESILPEALKAGGALRGISWNSLRSPLTIWPPLFIDNAIIAGEQTEGSGRLIVTAPGSGGGPGFAPIVLPEFAGVDFFDVAWHPSGQAALAVGGTDTEAVAFLVQRAESGPPEWTATEVYRAAGAPLKGVAFSPDGMLALMVGGQSEVGPAVLARVLRFDTGTGAVADLTGQAGAAGIEFRDVVFRPAPPIMTPTEAPVPVNIAALVGGNTEAGVAAAIAYAAWPGGGNFTPLFARRGPAINAADYDRAGMVLVGVCDQPAGGGNAPVLVASPGGVVGVDSGVAKSLRSVSLRKVGELVAWPLRPLPPIVLPVPEGDVFLEALSIGLKSSLVEGSLVHGLTALVCNITPPAPCPTCPSPEATPVPVAVWVVLDLNRNGVRDPGEYVLGRAEGTTGAPIRVGFAAVLPLPPGADAALLVGVEWPPTTPADAAVGPLGTVVAVADVLALGAQSDRVLFVRGLPLKSAPILRRLILKLGAWPNPFSPNGDGVKDETDVVIALLRPAECTLMLFNREGALVRTLADHQAFPAGRNPVHWDGKNAAGEIVPDGVYAARAWAVDADGVRDAAVAPVVVDTAGPVVSDLQAVPPVFSPNNDGRAEFTRIVFKLNETAGIAVKLYRDATFLGDIYWGVRPPGPSEVLWNGKIGGVVVPDGRYRIAVLAQDMAGNRAAAAAWTGVAVDTVRPEIRGLRAAPATFSPNGDGVADTTTISYGLSERSRLYLLVTGPGVRILLADGEWQAAGSHAVVWDGLVSGTPVPNGTYRVSAFAIDEAANPSLIPSIPVTVANPAPPP